MKNLTGKTALITGGASGIGLAIGRRLAESGMKIALADIETPILEEAVSELKELNYEAIGIQCDVSDLDSMKGMKSQIAETFGNPELICLNAGVGFGASISEATIGDWEWVIGVNLWGIINGLNIFLPALREMDEGHVVITASIAGHVSIPNLGPYNATKFAAVTIAETLRHELRADNSAVGVSCLCPGFVATNIFNSERNRPENFVKDSSFNLSDADLLQREAFMEWINANAKQPSEVAELVYEAISNDKFWIFTDDQHIDAVNSRHSSIITGDELPEPSALVTDL